MVLLADKTNVVGDAFTIVICLMIFIVLPVLITIACKYNVRMDKAEKAANEGSEPDTAPQTDAEAKVSTEQ